MEAVARATAVFDVHVGYREASAQSGTTSLRVLVDDSRRAQFEERLEDLAEAVHERMRLRLVGPVAPYDFVGELSWA